MKTLIYYFSGTGNTLWTAKKLRDMLPDSEILDIAREYREQHFEISADKLIFLFPSYAYEIPKMVRLFIKKAKINARYIAAGVTYGSHYGGSLAEVKRLLKRKKIRLALGLGIPAVENYIPIFGAPKQKTLDKRLPRHAEATTVFYESVLAERTNYVFPFRPLSSFVSILFRLFKGQLVKLYRVSDECTRCGICEKACPAYAVTIEGNEKPRFGKACEQCQACLNWCPQKAITFVRMKAKTPRYRHPEIKTAEMLRYGEEEEILPTAEANG